MSYLEQELRALQASDETVFDFIQESTLAGLWYWNLTGDQEKWATAKFWRSLDYEPDAQFNQAAAWKAAISPEEETATAEYIATSIADNTYSFDQVVQATCHDGSTMWLHCWGLVLRNNLGQPHRLLGVLVDITRQRNEEISAQEVAGHYGAILGNQSVYIIRTDARGNYTYVNDFFYERFGLDSKIIGTSSLMSIIEEDRAKCLVTVGLCFEEPNVPHQVILRKPYHDNAVKSNHWEFKGIVGSNGEVVEIQCVGYDVTLLVDNLERSKQLLALTNQQNARLQNFAYIISHNIRSHSANLTALVKFLQNATDEAQATMFLEMLKTSTDKLAETIINLNEIVTVNNMGLQPKEMRGLRQEVSRTLEAMNVLIHESQLTVTLNIPEEVTVQVVPAYLDSILLNLLSNAIKYRSASASPQLTLDSYREGDYTVLSVADNGRGIDMARNHNKIFGMYKTFHDNEDARGLGLFIVKNQIEAMNGKIEVASEVGVGTTFKVYFSEIV
ncbi:PAS domain-containing sensor histidine kinase [Hymenobacter sp. 5516J-16]|uniref:sensor histidine kinase n=1 Tax=Hymenobacter sp. 5516J-16 TaxID=2932253 RepID=UPI001FD5C64F|nr:PAS domain-containing sensor histidine kinase [Hymenobacter sp. 5516J-16]UOQ77778.1 PAS domain-containing sensor histidine kinase [Hymenobacter sp. 5516J-16]